MKWKDFVIDRLGYVVVYAVGLILVITVVELDMLSQGIALRRNNLLYIIVLSAAVLIVYIGVDYARQHTYYRQLRTIQGQPRPMERMMSIPDGVTREQQLIVELIRSMYRGYENQLVGYRKQQEQHDLFTRQWVHQMKTPVSVIHLLTQQTDASDDHPVPSVLNSIQEENERLANSLDIMLQTARLEKFELDVHVHEVDLERIVRGVINEHKKAWIRTGLFPKLVVAEEARYVRTDEKWISVVIRQLISNALKYAKPKKAEGAGSRQLEVILRPHEEAGMLAVFRDNGIGIAEQDLPRVFDPFFTGENGRLVKESTGMGLYLAKEVCRRLGHRIEIASVLGEGTTVSIYFMPPQVLHDVLHTQNK